MSQQSVRHGRDGRRWMPKQYGAKNVPIENASSVLSRSPC